MIKFFILHIKKHNIFENLKFKPQFLAEDHNFENLNIFFNFKYDPPPEIAA